MGAGKPHNVLPVGGGLFPETDARQSHHIMMGVMYLGEVVGIEES